MSVKDCKDLPLELDSVVLTGRRGLPGLELQNKTAGAESLIYEFGADTLAVVSKAAGAVDSIIAFEAQDTLGVLQTPLLMTGDGVNIDGVLTINGVPFVPSGNENIEDVLTVGDDAGGLSITNVSNIDLTNINGLPYINVAAVGGGSQTIVNLASNLGDNYISTPLSGFGTYLVVVFGLITCTTPGAVINGIFAFCNGDIPRNYIDIAVDPALALTTYYVQYTAVQKLSAVNPTMTLQIECKTVAPALFDWTYNEIITKLS